MSEQQRCGAGGCGEIAAVIVADSTGAEMPACRVHWGEMLDRSGGRIRAVRLAAGEDSGRPAGEARR